jgi:hypothetical protein
MLTLLTQLPRGPGNQLYGPPSPNAGSIGLQGQVPASRGAVMAAPRLRLGAGERPGRDLRAGASGWHCGARSGSAACMRPGRAGEPQSAEAGLPAANAIQRRRSPRTAQGAKQERPRGSPYQPSEAANKQRPRLRFVPFLLVRGDANQRRETPEKLDKRMLFSYNFVLALRFDFRGRRNMLSEQQWTRRAGASAAFAHPGGGESAYEE